jgi:hypothetical protein
MKFLSVQFTLASCQFLLIRSKYFPQQPVLEHFPSVFVLQRQGPFFTPIKEKSYNLIFIFPGKTRGDKNFEVNGIWDI